MQKKNKIVQKYSKPYYIAATAFAAIGLATIFSTHRHITVTQNFAQTHPDVETDNSVDFLAVLLVITCALLSYFGFFIVPGTANRKAKDLTQQYINEEIQKHPELNKYKQILNDTKYLETVAAIVCDELSEEEQRKIIKIAKEFDYIESKEQTCHIDNEILNIVRQHAVQHPEYIGNIKSVLENINKTYVMQPVSKTR
jgi:hypothetical protein